ncbi:MAG: sterol desaturase family protein [Deltaproteobacteria bacterium]|nr:sterol desaturase family protein [Deltaproteobacteria bacterium]
MILPDAGFDWNVTQHEAALRAGFFLAIFAVVAVAETAAPRRPRALKRSLRWLGNLCMHVVNALFPRLLFPVLPVGMAVLWAEKGWGLLNIIPAPRWVAAILTLVALDGLVYVQHFLFHRVRPLWLLHRMHHTDMDLDLTSALRFHPLEILISLLLKMAMVALLGPPAAVVLAFEVLLNGMAMFTHANLRIPAPADGLLRQVFVTPDMHRFHHSVLPREFNRNFGFNLSLWDRLFKTYQAQPAAGHTGMTIGLTGFRDPAYARFWKMMLLPWEKR